jgi:DNA-binding MarR family transcriptional regulator
MSQSLCSRTVAALSKWQRRGTPGLDLIEAIEDPRERRRKIMYLSPKGRQRMTRALEALTGEAVYYDAPSARDARKSFIDHLNGAPASPSCRRDAPLVQPAVRRSGVAPWPRVSDD